MLAARVANAIQTACPGVATMVSIGKPEDKATWRVVFADGATDAQQAAAQAVIQAFDPNAVEPEPEGPKDLSGDVEKLREIVAKQQAFIERLAGEAAKKLSG